MIRLENIKKSYRVAGQDVPALRDVSLEIGAGEIYGIVGHSGAGKSTLVRVINRLEEVGGGQVWVDGEEVTALSDEGLRALRQRIGMIFQHFNLLGSRTIAQNVAVPLRIAGELTDAQIEARVDELLALVGLTDQRNKYPSQLSGGQKQRVGIARALANRPKVLLCDEATSALDPQTTRQVLDLLAEINRSLGLTIVVITHEMDVVRTLCDRVAVLDGGVIVEQGPVTEVFLHPQHPTTRRFVLEAEHQDEGELGADLAQAGGKLVRLTFIGAATYQPVLAQAVRDHAIDFTILTGRIERIKTTPCGQLVVSLAGNESQIAATLAQLKGQGVRIEELN